MAIWDIVLTKREKKTEMTRRVEVLCGGGGFRDTNVVVKLKDVKWYEGIVKVFLWCIAPHCPRCWCCHYDVMFCREMSASRAGGSGRVLDMGRGIVLSPIGR